MRSTVSARRPAILMAGAAAAALLAATHAGAGRPQTPAADTYSWRFKFTKNDIHRYRVKTEYTGSLPAVPAAVSTDPQPSSFHVVGRSVARQEVHKVNDDGQASLLIVPENPSFENKFLVNYCSMQSKLDYLYMLYFYLIAFYFNTV